MDNRINRAKEIIDNNINIFLDKIHSISEISAFKKTRRSRPDFEILCPGNEEFHQYSHYEKTLEWYIRDDLVNQSLKELFNLYEIDALWPNTEGKICVGFNNEHIEDVYPLQFILADSKSGYRYTSLCVYDDEFEEFLSDYDLKEIIIIDWSIKGNQRNHHSDKRVSVKTIETVITELFSHELYIYFIDALKDAVARANDEIGFQTIPRLSLRYLSSFRGELTSDLYETNYKGIHYKVLDSDNDLSKEYEKISFDESDYEICEETFKKNGLYKALVGTESFAKCFVTAEYLFNIFKDGNNFDYTSVISGYLKSVEQLVYKIVKVNLKQSKMEYDWWIKKNNINMPKSSLAYMCRKNPKTGKQQVRFVEENEKYFDITLAPLLWFLYDNKRYRISDNGIEKIHKLLLRYSQECRNDHFHKDNIDSFEEVKCIRNDTYLILYLLLGGCSISDNDLNLKDALGIVDNSFDRLYKRLIEIPKSVRRFIISVDGNEFAVRRLIDQDDVVYDEYGTLINNSIKFVKEENYTDIEDEPNMTADTIIDSSNIPDAIWFVKPGGERVPIEW